MHEGGGAATPGWLSVPARVALAFAAMYFVTGVSTPFLPVWLESRGLTVGQIGLLTIVPQLVRMACSPAVGFEADRRQAHRSLVMWLSGLGLAAWLLLAQAPGFVVALAAMAAIALSNAMGPLVESIAMAGVRTQDYDYGRMRLWGSASFVVANLFGGWLASSFGNGAVIWLMVAGAAATLCVSLLLQQPGAMDAVAGVRRRLTLADARGLLLIPNMSALLLAAGAVQGAHGMFYAYGTLHWQAQGIGANWFGVLWAVGLVTEIALFWWSKEAVRRIGAAELLVFGAGLSVLRWTLMAFDPPLPLLLPLQVLHGLTFGASHLGAMHVLARIAPPDQSATAQALYALVSTLGVVVATAIAARVYPSAGGMTYLAMAMIAAAGLAAAERMRRRVG